MRDRLRALSWVGLCLGFAVGVALTWLPSSDAARNASGVYSLPAGNPVVTGTSITSTWANNTLNDIKTEITNSLDRNGRGAMVSPLQLSSGSSALPSLTFGTDTNSGVYLSAADAPAMSAGGVQAQTWSTTGSTFPLTCAVTGAFTAAKGATVTQSTANGHAVAGTGNGTGQGGYFIGGSTSGTGVYAVGGTPNGSGLYAVGAGTGLAIETESGVSFVGASNQTAVVAIGSGTGRGGNFTGGATNGGGIISAGVGTGSGITATGGATGTGVIGNGGATSGVGGNFTGGATNSAGLTATGGSTNGVGAILTGAGTGVGLSVANGTAATGGTRRNAIYATNGDISFAGVAAPTSTTAVSNALTPTNFAKGWALVTFTAGSPAVTSGFNITSVSCSSNDLHITWASAFTNSNFAVVVTGSPSAELYSTSNSSSTVTNIHSVDMAGATVNLCGAGSSGKVNVVAMGLQ